MLDHYMRKPKKEAGSASASRQVERHLEEDIGQQTEEGKQVRITASTSGQQSEEATAQQTAVTSKNRAAPSKKKFRITDPANIAPHYYHKDLFRANFPLVDVIEVPAGYRFPVRDKFEGAVLDQDTTYEARREWACRMFDAEDVYKEPADEKQALPLHFAFLEPLKKLTRPSRADVEKQNRYSRKRKWRYEDIMHIGRPKARRVQEEDHEGMYIVADEEELQEPLGGNRSDGDNSGLRLALEETVDLQGDLMENEDVPTGFADGVVHIFYDRGIDIAAGGNPDRVAAILERKFAEDNLKVNAKYQGGFYAVQHSLENFSRGHGTPVYVVVMTSTTWSYGILVPEGYVQVRNGAVAAGSMDKFRQHQAVSGVSTMDYGMLEAKLQAGTDFYRSCFRENPTALYRDGLMLVGKFYVASEWYDLPKAAAGGGMNQDVNRLFDGLLRLVLGDSVMDLSKTEFQERLDLRERMRKERLDAWFFGPA